MKPSRGSSIYSNLMNCLQWCHSVAKLHCVNWWSCSCPFTFNLYNVIYWSSLKKDHMSWELIAACWVECPLLSSQQTLLGTCSKCTTGNNQHSILTLKCPNFNVIKSCCKQKSLESWFKIHFLGVCSRLKMHQKLTAVSPPLVLTRPSFSRLDSYYFYTS